MRWESGAGTFTFTREQVGGQEQKRDQDGQPKRRFHGWSLAELAGPHFTRNLSRKAGGVFNSRTENVLGSRLDEYQALLQWQSGQNTSSRATIQAFFLKQAFSRPNP